MIIEKIKKETNIIVYGILWILVFLIISFTTRGGDPSIGKWEKTNIMDFGQEWMHVVDGKNIKIDLPESLQIKDSNEGGETVISKVLPKEIKADDCLFMATCHTTLQVYVEEKLIYQYGQEKDSFFHVPTNSFHTIPLKDAYAGKQVTLIFTSQAVNYVGKIGQIQYGDEMSFFMQYIHDNLFSILVCVLILGLGIFLFVVWIAMRRIVAQNQFLYLSLFAFNMFMWVVTETYLPQFFMGEGAAFTVLAFEALILMPIPFLLLFRENAKPLQKKVTTIFMGTTSGCFVLCNALFLGKIADLCESIWIVHINLVVGACAILSVSFWEVYQARKTGKPDAIKISVWGLLFLTCMAIIDIISYYITSNVSGYNFVKIGLIGYILTFSMDAVREGFQLVRLGEKAAEYEDLAYRDMLTGVFNRTAYREDMQFLDANATKRANTVLLVVDINNLKMVNDAMGHAVGDRYILSNVELLRKHFEDLGKIYRIGGDEFVVLITEMDDDQFRWAIHKMEQDVDSDGVSNFAFGYAYFEMEDGSIQNTAKRADALMYQKKTRQKQGR